MNQKPPPQKKTNISASSKSLKFMGFSPAACLMVMERSYSGEKFCGSSELKQTKSLGGWWMVRMVDDGFDAAPRQRLKKTHKKNR